MDDIQILEACARQMTSVVTELSTVASLPPIAVARLTSVIKSIHLGIAEIGELAIVARVRSAMDVQTLAGGAGSDHAGGGEHVPAPENGSPRPDATKPS